MKKVFSNTDQAIHIWAQRSQEEGRNSSSSISFDSGTLYSYSTPIAVIMEVEGKRIVLHTVETYSVTTSSQQSAARQATNHLPSFHVKYLGDNMGHGRAPRVDSGQSWHQANMANYAMRYEDLLLKASRARDNAEYRLEEADSLQKEAARYGELFGVPFLRAMFPLPDSQAAEAIKERAKLALKAKAAATAEDKKLKRKTLQATINALIAGEDVRLDYNWNIYALPAQIDQVIAYAAQVWRETGEALQAVRLRDLPPMIRVDGEEIVTSWGARFPKIFAAPAFRHILLCRETKKTWVTNGHKIPLGDFRIDSIDEAGNVVAGCHKVTWEAIAPVARHLGLLSEVAA